MRKPKNEYRKISVQMTLAQENQLKRMSALENKSISAYVRDRIFSSTLDTAKIDLYQNINDNLSSLQKGSHLTINLLRLIINLQLNLISKENAQKYLDKVFGNPQKKN